MPETQAAWLRPGSTVEARVAAYPDEKFEGRIGAILPEVTAATRTLRARIELKNPHSRLKPGMFATLVFRGRSGKEAVLVPSEAVIRTGSRDVVLVRADALELLRADGGAGDGLRREAACARAARPGAQGRAPG